MRRVRYYKYGGPEVLQLEEADIPTAGAGEVLIRVEVVGANFVDTKMRQGAGSIFRRPLPGSLTGDVVGIVEAVGPDVDAALVGSRVAALVASDAFADYAIAEAAWLAPVPDGLDAAGASMLPLGVPVALRTLRSGQLAKGETVLIHAAAGGIGHLAVQLAKLLGAGMVIATASSPAKLDFARSYGADIAINYTDDDWADQVRTAVPGGVDLITDSVGGQLSLQSLELLAPFGRQVFYGAAGGDLIDVPVRNLFGLKQVVGFSLLAWRVARPASAREEMSEVAGYLANGQVKVALHSTLSLTDVAEAHRILEGRTQLGRILLRP